MHTPPPVPVLSARDSHWSLAPACYPAALLLNMSLVTHRYLDNGFHYMSVGYRLVATKYLWGAAGTEEEFIHAAADGTLTLDKTGLPLSSYKVHAGRTEFNTKCSYDAAQALEHLITHAVPARRRKNAPLLRHLSCEHRSFAKIGSGQTQGKLKKETTRRYLNFTGPAAG